VQAEKGALVQCPFWGPSFFSIFCFVLLFEKPKAEMQAKDVMKAQVFHEHEKGEQKICHNYDFRMFLLSVPGSRAD